MTLIGEGKRERYFLKWILVQTKFIYLNCYHYKWKLNKLKKKEKEIINDVETRQSVKDIDNCQSVNNYFKDNVE